MEKSVNLRGLPDFVKFYLPALVWMAVIFTLSSMPGSTFQPMEFPDAHLVAHSLLFGVLYYFTYRALKHQDYSRLLSGFSPIFALIFVVLYGASDEYHQSFTPGRSEEMKDFLIDVTAAAVVMAAVVIADRIRDRKKKIETS